MSLNTLMAMVTFLAVGTGSPGPNNTLLLASGVTFGFRRTIPHVLGTGVGMVLLVAITAAGAGVVVTAAPGVKVVLKVIASAYLVYLACRLARGLVLDTATVGTPFSVGRAAGFQFVNPKAWIFVLALVSGYAADVSAGVVGIVLLTVWIVVVATASLWALGGTTLSRALQGARARRVAGVTLGILLLASVAFVWI